jgi:hypothetical protein
VTKINLDAVQVMEYAMLGIKNGNPSASYDLLNDYVVAYKKAISDDLKEEDEGSRE